MTDTRPSPSTLLVTYTPTAMAHPYLVKASWRPEVPAEGCKD